MMNKQRVLAAVTAPALCLLLAAGALASGEPEEAPVSAEPFEAPSCEADAAPAEADPQAELSPWEAARLLCRLVGLGEPPAPEDDRNGDGIIDPADAALMLPATGRPPEPSDPTEPTEPPTEPATPPLEADDFAWNGAPALWLAGTAAEADELEVLSWILQDYMKGDGWTQTVRTAETAAEQEALLREAAGARTAGAVILRPMDTAALRDAALEAQRAGVVVVYLNAEPDYPVSGYLCHDYPLAGRYGAETAEHWAAETGDGPTETVLITSDETDADARVAAGAREALEDADVLTLTAEAAADADMDALIEAHPGCRVYIACELQAALRLADALAARCAGTGGSRSLAEYCVVACGERGAEGTDAVLEAFSAAKEDAAASAVKGYALSGDILEARGCILYAPIQQQGLRMVNIIQSACGASGYSLPYGSACCYSVFYANTLGHSNLPVRGGLRPPVEPVADEPAEDGVWLNMAA